MSEDGPARPGTDAHSPGEASTSDRPVSTRLPPPPPKEADDQVVTGTITAGWAIALVASVVASATGALPPGAQWWPWTCVTGLAMGLFGLWYVPRLKTSRTRAAAQRPLPPGQREDQPSAEPSSESRDSGSKTVSSTETPGSSTRS